MSFMELLLAAKRRDDDAIGELLAHYDNVLRKNSVVKGIFEEDLYQEQCIVFTRCIETFNAERQCPYVGNNWG